MEDTIEICSGCGKMPRAIDLVNGSFICTRCGNNQLMAVTGDDYEKVATELDRIFQETVAQKRFEVVEKEMPNNTPDKTRNKAVRKKPKAAKKTAKKKARPKAKKVKSKKKR